MRARQVEPHREVIDDIDGLDGMNDRGVITTAKGIAIAGKKAFGVQYHPEASPGPSDSAHLFRRFADLIEREKGGAG